MASGHNTHGELPLFAATPGLIVLYLMRAYYLTGKALHPWVEETEPAFNGRPLSHGVERAQASR